MKKLRPKEAILPAFYRYACVPTCVFVQGNQSPGAVNAIAYWVNFRGPREMIELPRNILGRSYEVGPKT